ncbi:gfo/Idh/MocA family oxidoreductase [Nostocoides sp. F2B08]|uniref:Gfo/Idh/MocA family protein n=1 Tax=Nostocoides sp. F2B08 TaxID=2653936 RepID=UPI0012631E14|nr:Gfo/Idh/MocA family oxidoreductase [Tetrasphaera sp. F2B08]KAB7745496.1 gfo/Idh/MocA family oxidoreductase [Tetrasphaera sp. F2B08]
MTEPLRIGILGAARIAPLAIVAPAQATGARLVAVAARDRSRAEAFAAEHSVERVLDSYAAVLDDPDVEVVYNPLPHGMHAAWNIRAIEAGKHVLTEKPSAANADDARVVREVLRVRRGRGDVPEPVFMEGFHYPYHPMFHRVVELIESGAVGEVGHIDVPLLMPDPGVDDPRWRWDLAGGSVMDLGCYSLSCLKLLGERFCGGAPVVVSAEAETREDDGRIDERLFVRVAFPSGATGSGGSDMAADDWSFTLVVTGTQGEIVVPAFPLPHQDDRIIVRSGGTSEAIARTRPAEFAELTAEREGDHVERLGSRSSYTYQLEALTAAVRQGASVVTDADFAVDVMELIDAAYAAAGLPSRPSSAFGA